jgi:hypothetical protein
MQNAVKKLANRLPVTETESKSNYAKRKISTSLRFDFKSSARRENVVGQKLVESFVSLTQTILRGD